MMMYSHVVSLSQQEESFHSFGALPGMASKYNCIHGSRISSPHYIIRDCSQIIECMAVTFCSHCLSRRFHVEKKWNRMNISLPCYLVSSRKVQVLVQWYHVKQIMYLVVSSSPYLHDELTISNEANLLRLYMRVVPSANPLLFPKQNKATDAFESIVSCRIISPLIVLSFF